jgi:carboxylate-amine ligase
MACAMRAAVDGRAARAAAQSPEDIAHYARARSHRRRHASRHAWRESKPSKGAPYNKLVRDVRMLALRNMFCGLHVHVEIPDSASRISVMNRLGPYLPLFLALSVSSPMWRGNGLACAAIA